MRRAEKAFRLPPQNFLRWVSARHLAAFPENFPFASAPRRRLFITFTLSLAFKMYFVRLSLNLRFICFLTHSRIVILSESELLCVCKGVCVSMCSFSLALNIIFAPLFLFCILPSRVWCEYFAQF